MRKNPNFFRYYISIITLLPLLFFTSKSAAGLSKYIIFIYAIIRISINYSYLNIDVDYILTEKWIEIENILFSDKQPEDPELAKEITKSITRVIDFINIAGKDGSGSYPEDFDYKGYKRDDRTIIHSKVPGDWGINELFNFGKYDDLSKRRESAHQMAHWLEYDHFVNKKARVNLSGDDPTFNPSGREWFKDYCKSTGTPLETRNNWALREAFRIIASGRK